MPRPHKAIAISLAAALIVGGGVTVATVWNPSETPGQAAERAAWRKVDEDGAAYGGMKTYTKTEFRRVLLGKSKREVIALLGSPESVHDAWMGATSFKYGAIDVEIFEDDVRVPMRNPTVWFFGDRAVRVTF